MVLDDWQSKVERSVWENKNGSRVTTVTTLLKPGEYTVKEREDDDGNTVLKYIPKEDS